MELAFTSHDCVCLCVRACFVVYDGLVVSTIGVLGALWSGRASVASVGEVKACGGLSIDGTDSVAVVAGNDFTMYTLDGVGKHFYAKVCRPRSCSAHCRAVLTLVCSHVPCVRTIQSVQLTYTPRRMCAASVGGDLVFVVESEHRPLQPEPFLAPRPPASDAPALQAFKVEERQFHARVGGTPVDAAPQWGSQVSLISRRTVSVASCV